MESLDDEIKTALQVNIVNYRRINFVHYYTIQICKIFSGDQHYIEKRFKEFYILNEKLRAKAYIDLPKLPQKTFLPMRNH